MRRPSVAAAGFALIDGQAVDPDGIVFIERAPDRWGRLLLACVEPGEFSARGLELAAVALRTLRQTFAGTPGPASEALVAAFAAANDALLAENRVLTTGRWERRICVGATAVAFQGREVYVAQAAPSQAILIQDQRVYAFPDLASWRGDYVPEAIVPESLPLGLAEDPGTQIFQSDAAPGDLIALCATSVGHELSRDDDSLHALFSTSLVTDDLEGSVDRLERLMVRKGIVSSFAVVASVSRLGASQPMVAMRSRSRRAVSNEPEPGSPTNDDPVRPPRGLVARDAMIGAAERLSRTRPAPAVDSAARKHMQAAPGAQSVQRYRGSGGIPVEVRANLPRGPVVHVPARVLAISVALLMVAGGAGATVNFQQGRDARAHAALAEVDRSLQDATANPLVATSMVTQAEQALDDARDSGADPALVNQYARALSAVRDNAWSMRRLQDVQMLGSVPGAAGAARLALSGDTLYVAAGDLYELHPEEKRLLLLLAQGAEIGGARVGKVRSVSVDGGAVIASDGDATYARDSQGTWQRRTLAVNEVGGISDTLPIVSWGDAAYGVSWEGDLIRFFDTSAGPQSEVWATSALNPDLLQVADFVIDGKIHLLLQDGRILTFSRGQLENTAAPFVTPRLTASRSLAQAPLAAHRYMVDGDTVIGGNRGRIIRVDQAGNTTQYLTPEDATVKDALADVGEVAIDELSGTVFWIADGVVWQARLPPAR